MPGELLKILEIGPEYRLEYIKSLESAQLSEPLDKFNRFIEKAVDRSLDIYLKAAKGLDASESQDVSVLMKIGKLSAKTNTPASTIRYWIQEGLIDISSFTKSGYWLFSLDTISDIDKIKGLQLQRFTINEIKQLLRKDN